MTEPELLARIAGGEGPLCEFKPRLVDAGVIRKAVVAFANTVRTPDAGVLFLGLDDRGKPTGLIAAPDQAQRSVESYLKGCYPPIQGVRPHGLLIDGKAVVAIEVPESRNAPHFTGPAYRRVGSESIEASPEMFEEMIADRTEVARLLRPWVGKTIRFEAEDMAGRTRRWSGSIGGGVLSSVDSVGLILDFGGGAYRTAAWSQVIMTPSRPGESPFIRISLD